MAVSMGEVPGFLQDKEDTLFNFPCTFKGNVRQSTANSLSDSLIRCYRLMLLHISTND